MARLSKQNENLLKAVHKQAAREQGRSKSPSTVSTSESTRNDSAVGLGVDLLEIERMERAIERTPRILERVFTSSEREYAWSKARPAVHYAAFFVAREAVLKALGCGFSGVNYADVEITHDSNGRPEVLLHGNASVIAEQQGIKEIQISLSHTHQMAVASAVAIKAQSSPPKNEHIDPREELARQFKELRSMLDDLGVSSILSQEDQAEAAENVAAENVAVEERAPETETEEVPCNEDQHESERETTNAEPASSEHLDEQE